MKVSRFPSIRGSSNNAHCSGMCGRWAALVAFLAFGVFMSPHAGYAQDQPPPAASPVAGEKSTGPSPQRLKYRQKRAQLPPNLPPGVKVEIKWAPPDPFGKLIAMEREFDMGNKPWNPLLAKIDKNIPENEFTETKFLIPLVIGARICDGLIAVKAKSDEYLKESANDIEDLGRKLKVPEEDLEYAKIIRNKALSGEWLEVYTNLSTLQNRVKRTMEASDRLTSALVMTGGWMRGAVYVGDMMQKLGDKKGDKLGTHPTYFLREPELVFYLADEIAETKASLPARAAQLEQIEASLDRIGCIIDIDSDVRKGKLSQEDLKELLQRANAILEMGFTNK